MKLLQTMMKRGSMLTLAALASTLLLTTSCDYDKAVPASELPAAAQTFVKKSYPLSKFCTRSGDDALIEAINK